MFPVSTHPRVYPQIWGGAAGGGNDRTGGAAGTNTGFQQPNTVLAAVLRLAKKRAGDVARMKKDFKWQAELSMAKADEFKERVLAASEGVQVVAPA